MSKLFFLARWAAFAAFAMVLLGPHRAFAQFPAVVEELKLITADDSRASFLIRFSPEEPDYSPLNVNPTQPELVMRTTLKAPRLPSRESHRGLVRATTFQNSDTGLRLMFDTAAPAEIAVQPAGDNSLQVVITRLSRSEAIGARPVGSTGQPVVPASEIPSYVDYYPGESYELVPLKYADVSEIIGLLVQGEQIQPNNIFIRREPGFRIARLA